MDKIALIAGSRDTADALYKQLAFFLSHKVSIVTYVIDEGIPLIEEVKLVVFSSKAAHDEVERMGKMPSVDKVIGQRTINYDGMDEIVNLQEGDTVLLVNDIEESAKEVELALLEIGLNHLHYALYFPKSNMDTQNFTTAITAGEKRFVPPHIKNVVDIGSRIFDFNTIAKILSFLNLMEESSHSFSKMYLEKIINVARRLAQSKSEAVRLNENLNRVIESFNAGVVLYNRNQHVLVLNDALRNILKINPYMPIGVELKKVVHNKRLLSYLTDMTNSLPIELTLDGVEYLVTKFELSDDGIICGSIKSIKRTTPYDEQMLKKGHIAKYGLEDIIGSSESVNKLKAIITKLAFTDMTMLIQGESGTGKELVASAIHNTSRRAYAPFLAVNFSALPDNLIESELFGYVEGAFTGAKKGGKRGLFEEANGGTIFLDEIGDVSLKVQQRLLRVLEEREIMPVGSNEIKSIDVRVIAATNKDLKKMVEEKTFREDLYFRLKMGFIHLHPLRERKEDIPELVDHFVEVMSTQRITVDEALMNKLMLYSWPGNIRELKNTINYMLAVRTADDLKCDDLPHEMYFGQTLDEADLMAPNSFVVHRTRRPTVQLNEEQLFLLKLIKTMLTEMKPVTRTTLSKETENKAHKRTENQIRRLLRQLEDRGLITLTKGRNGIMITLLGEEQLTNAE